MSDRPEWDDFIWEDLTCDYCGKKLGEHETPCSLGEEYEKNLL